MKGEAAPPHRDASPPLRAGDLAGLDTLDAEAVALFSFSDVRPLKGVAGYFDWRLSGALSDALMAGQFGGATGEVVLMPVSGRLGRRRLFLFGLGALSELSPQRLQLACGAALSVVRRAGVRRLLLGATPIPGQSPPEGTFVEAARVACAADAGLVAGILVENMQRL